MNEDKIPEWHAEELRFLTAAGVLGVQKDGLPPDDAGITCVKKRWIHSTLRQVYITDNGFVIKRYSHFPGRKDYRLPWRREHRALQRLTGLNVPTTHGYIRVRHSRQTYSHTFVRTLLPGSELSWKSERQIDQAAKLLVSFHRLGVVTLDPSRENFIQTEDGNIGFIDFGRARTFSRGSPLAPINMGKDLFRLLRTGELSREQFDLFLDRYRFLMAARALRGTATVAWLSFRFLLLKNRKRLLADANVGTKGSSIADSESRQLR